MKIVRKIDSSKEIKQSNSQNNEITIQQKITELSSIFLLRLKEWINPSISEAKDKVAEYDNLLKKYTNKKLQSCSIFEIGYGEQPDILRFMLAKGFNAEGIDLDCPIISKPFASFKKVYEKNGLERAIKSFVGYFLGMKRRKLFPKLKKKDEKKFLVGDILDFEIKNNSLDLIFSEDVFEHLPPPTIRKILPKMARWLKPSGIALIRPNIFTGITGGHLLEWYAQNLNTTRKRSEAWEHLRQNRFVPNTYLNKLSRKEYRKMFSKCFIIEEEIVKNPDLGRSFFTNKIKKELVLYPEEELFSNQVLFILKPKLNKLRRLNTVNIIKKRKK